MDQGGTTPAPTKDQDQWPWWAKWVQKAACVLAGSIDAVVGIFVLVSLHAMCITAGVLQILIGLIIIMLEAPCCCSYVDFIDTIAKFSDTRPHWQKAILYCGMPIIPIAMCPEISTVMGNVLIILCGFSFAFMALGRKASREEMIQTARSQTLPTDKSNLTGNVEPISQTAPPQAYTSNIV